MQLVFAPNSPELAATTQFLVQGALQQWLGDLIARRRRRGRGRRLARCASRCTTSSAAPASARWRAFSAGKGRCHDLPLLRRTAPQRRARPTPTLNGIDYLEVLDHDAPPGSPRQRTLLVRLLKPVPAGLQRPSRCASKAASACATSASSGSAAAIGAAGRGDRRRAGVLRGADRAGPRAGGAHRPRRRLLHLHAAPGALAAGRPRRRWISIRACRRSTSRSRSNARATSTASRVAGLPAEPAPAPDINYLAKDYASFRRLMLDRITPAGARTGASAAPPTSASRWSSCSPTSATSSATSRTPSPPRPISTPRAGASRCAATRCWSTTHARRLQRPRLAACARRWPAASCSLPAGIALPARSVAGAAAAHRARTRPTSERRCARSRWSSSRCTTRRCTRAHNEIRFYTWGDRRCCLPKGATARDAAPATCRDLRARRRAAVRGSAGAARPARPATPIPPIATSVRLTAVRALADDPTAPLTDPLAGDRDHRDRLGAGGRAAVPAVHLGASPTRRTARRCIDDVSVARGNIVLADHGHTVRPTSRWAPCRRRGSHYPPDRDTTAATGAGPMPLPPRFRPRWPKAPLTFAGTVLKTTDVGRRAHHRARCRSIPTRRPPRRCAWRMRGRAARDRARQHARQRSSQAWAAAPRPAQQRRRRRRTSSSRSRTTAARALRFGDDTHGRRPATGTAFTARYRVGNGRAGNVGADSDRPRRHRSTRDIVGGAQSAAGARRHATRRTPPSVRRRAPQAFRTQERAVTPADYAEVTERHAGVQRAAATLRWTGSWHTVFVTVDREGGVPVDAAFETDDGRATSTATAWPATTLEFNDPVYVSLEIDLLVCVDAELLPRRRAAPACSRCSSSRVLRRRHGAGCSTRTTSPSARPSTSARSTPPRAHGGRRRLGAGHALPAPGQRRPAATSRDGFMALGRLEIARLDNDPNFPEHGVLRLDAVRRQVDERLPTLNDLRLLRRPRRRDAARASTTRRACRRSPTASARHARLQGVDAGAAVERRAARRWRGLDHARRRRLHHRPVRRARQSRSTCSPSTRSASPTRTTCAPPPSGARCCELARLIGYELAPGVAAAHPAGLHPAGGAGQPGAAPPRRSPSRSARGCRACPGQDEQPQTFETVAADRRARAEWNAIPVQTDARLAARVRRHDAVARRRGDPGCSRATRSCIVGAERLDDPGSERWDMRRRDQRGARQRTTAARAYAGRTAWATPFRRRVRPASGAQVYVFRQRAALFGHNAPDPRLMAASKAPTLDKLIDGTGVEPALEELRDRAAQTSISTAPTRRSSPAAGSRWSPTSPASASADLPGYVELYRADQVAPPSAAATSACPARSRASTPDTDENLDRRPLPPCARPWCWRRPSR